jgi:ABC-type transport system involved in cytochrome c biogenesis permease subunit
MEIKYTIQGLLIYITIAAYLLALLSIILRRPKAGQFLYFLGFMTAAISICYRWYHAGHVPLQNLFEVFLFLGMIYPVSLFSRYVLHVGGQTADILIGVIVLIPAGFVFNAEPQKLPPALQSWLFAPHVAVYMLSYIFMAKAAYHGLLQLADSAVISKENYVQPEESTYRLICTGFPLLTLGLILGSVWGKLAWGDYWGWDPKELWGLACWMIYVGYLHFRYMFAGKFPKINSLWAIAGLTAIVITLLCVNLSRLFPGLHSYAS